MNALFTGCTRGGAFFCALMRSLNDSLTVDMPADLRKQSDVWICDMVRKTVRANQERDDDLYRLRQQLEGVSLAGGDGPWPNSCVLQDPVTREFHMTAQANIVAAFRQKPYVTLEALRPNDDAVVTKLEVLANTEADLFGFDQALATLTYIALESRYAVCGVFYSTTRNKHKELLPVPPPIHAYDEGEGAVEDDELSPTSEQLYQINDIIESFEFRPIDTWDFYLSPVGSQKVQQADHTLERLWLTTTALLDGVKNEGFDAKAVSEMVKRKPTAVREGGVDPRRDQQELSGIYDDNASFYECFRVVGRMPYLFDGLGEPQTPEELLDEDFLWMVCPAHQIVFKLTYSPFPVRPYALGKAMGPDTEMLGHGIVSTISAIADEMTILLRATVDSTNATMDPQMKVPEHLAGWYSQKDNRRPGSILPYRGNDPNSVQAVHRDFQGLQIGMELSQGLYGRAAQIAAAQGVNSMAAGKVRKAAEVEFTAQVIQNKFGLMLGNIAKMVQEIFRIYFALRKYHLRDSVNVRTGTGEDQVTRDDMDVQFRIIPHADADNASSQQRLDNDTALIEFLGQNHCYQQRIQMGDLTGDWMVGNRVLSHMGIRNPEAFIGPQPQPMDPMAIIQRIFPIVMQGAQMQDPIAIAIVQAVQQMQQTAQTGGGQGVQQGQGIQPGVGMNLPAMPGSPSFTQSPMGGQPVVPHVSINLKDSPPWAQKQELASAGYVQPMQMNGVGH